MKVFQPENSLFNSDKRDFHPVKTDEKVPSGTSKLSSHFCTCSGQTCTCCADIHEESFHLNDTLCVDVGYLKEDYGLKFELTWDGRVIISEEISGRNPPPICAEIPIPKAEVRSNKSVNVQIGAWKVAYPGCNNYFGTIWTNSGIIWKIKILIYELKTN